MKVSIDYVVEAVLACRSREINRQLVGIAKQVWTLGPDVGDRRAAVGPHPNSEMAFHPGPVILPIVDVSSISADRFHARWKTSSFLRVPVRRVPVYETPKRPAAAPRGFDTRCNETVCDRH
jgi:hypothetical protein